MAQGEVGTLVELPLTWALVEGKAQGIVQRGVGEADDEIALRMGLGHPFLGAAEGLSDCGVFNAGIEDAFLQFQEEASDATALV